MRCLHQCSSHPDPRVGLQVHLLIPLAPLPSAPDPALDIPQSLACADSSQAPVSSKKTRTFLKPGQAIVPKITWGQDFHTEGLRGNPQDPAPHPGPHSP